MKTKPGDLIKKMKMADKKQDKKMVKSVMKKTVKKVAKKIMKVTPKAKSGKPGKKVAGAMFQRMARKAAK